LREAPDPSGAEVAEDIASRQRWNCRPAVNVAAGHGNAFGVAVFRNRQHQAGHVAPGSRVETVQPFHHAPAEIPASLQDVDFLELVLPDIAGEQSAGGRIEGKTEWV